MRRHTRAVPPTIATQRPLPDLVPDAGHLRHMPSHIDVLCGQYHDAVVANSKAIEADARYLEREGPINFYTLYRCHNYHFKLYAAMFLGQYRTALDAANQMIATIPEELLRVEHCLLGLPVLAKPYESLAAPGARPSVAPVAGTLRRSLAGKALANSWHFSKYR